MGEEDNTADDLRSFENGRPCDHLKMEGFVTNISHEEMYFFKKYSYICKRMCVGQIMENCICLFDSTFLEIVNN